MQAVIAYFIGVLKGCFAFLPFAGRYFNSAQYEPLSTSDNRTWSTTNCLIFENKTWLTCLVTFVIKCNLFYKKVTGSSTPLYQYEARRFLQRFNLKYGTNHPVFFVGAGGSATTLTPASADGEASQQQQQQQQTASSSSSSSSNYESVFDEIMERAKREYKIVLVYLHSEQHQNTPNFCQYVNTLMVI